MDNDEIRETTLDVDFKGPFYQLVEGQYVLTETRHYRTRDPDDEGYWVPNCCTFVLMDWSGKPVSEHEVTGELFKQVCAQIERDRKNEEMEAAALRRMAA
jgi:hypothetical protein